MSDSSSEIFLAIMPVLFHRVSDDRKALQKVRLISAGGRVIGNRNENGNGKARSSRIEQFRLSPREHKLSQIVAAKLVANEFSSSPGLAFAIGLEADRIRAARQFLGSAAKRQSFIKAVIDEVGARTKQRDSLAIYTDRALDRISQRCTVEEAHENHDLVSPQPAMTIPETVSSSSSSSSESGCSFRIVRFISEI